MHVMSATRALALEWSHENVKVNVIGIGWMGKLIQEGQKDSISSYIPMYRRGEPEDVAPLVLFLASEASSHPTGHVYSIDAGLLAIEKKKHGSELDRLLQE